MGFERKQGGQARPQSIEAMLRQAKAVISLLTRVVIAQHGPWCGQCHEEIKALLDDPRVGFTSGVFG